MPLVNRNGPKWSRPLVVSSETRLSGINPVLRFLAALVRPRKRAAGPPAANGKSGDRGA
jgi:hypothetical protein